MTIMNAIAEIDKAGRLVVPKKLREALHLTPGTRISLNREGDAIVLRHESTSRGLVEIDGLLVHQSGAAHGQSDFSLLQFIEGERDKRLMDLGGDVKPQ